MIPILDTPDLDMAEHEIGLPCEQLLAPWTFRRRFRPDDFFAIDNGAFSGFDPEIFHRLLNREYENRHFCRFVAVPDIVGSARRTLEVFDHWKYKLPCWRLAFVVQDGQEDLPIPWNGIAAIFIGGTTKFKLSQAAGDIVRAAKAMDKWVHAGRVNTPGRFEYFEAIGADSIDGTGLSRFSHMREQIYRNALQPKLM